jgi:hypothetical protein
MSKRLSMVVWSMLATFAVGLAVAIPLAVLNGSYQLGDWPLLLAFAAFMVVGAVIVAHRPGNAIGWVFAMIGLLVATGALAQEYAIYAYVTRPGSLPGAVVAAWYHQQFWIPMLTLVSVFTLLLFPTGRLLSARWRPVAAAAAAATAGIGVLTALQPTITLQDTDYTIRNPIGLTGGPDPETSRAGVMLRLSRSPWNLGGGRTGDQAASSLVGVTAVAILWSRVARRAGRCRWPLTRRNCLAASSMPAAIQRSTICPSCQRLTLTA